MDAPDLSWLDEAHVDADCPADVREALGLSPLLDTPETTGNLLSPVDYRSWRCAQAPEEIAATREALEAIYLPYVPEKLARFDDCRKRAFLAVHRETRRVRVLSSACRDRWCVFCARARASEVSEQVNDWLNRVKNPRTLTLTLKSSSAPLADQIDALYKSFRAFRKLKEIKHTIKAGIWFFQITFNSKTQQFHPHLHCVIIGKYRPTEFYSLLWSKVTHGSMIVHIRAARNPRSTADYVGRYVARPCLLSAYDLAHRIEIIRAFFGRRLFGTWGPKPIRPEIRRRKLDRDAWVTLKSWLEIFTERTRDETAKIIWECWQSGDPLPERIWKQPVTTPVQPGQPPGQQATLFKIEPLPQYMK